MVTVQEAISDVERAQATFQQREQQIQQAEFVAQTLPTRGIRRIRQPRETLTKQIGLARGELGAFGGRISTRRGEIGGFRAESRQRQSDILQFQAQRSLVVDILRGEAPPQAVAELTPLGERLLRQSEEGRRAELARLREEQALASLPAGAIGSGIEPGTFLFPDAGSLSGAFIGQPVASVFGGGILFQESTPSAGFQPLSSTSTNGFTQTSFLPPTTLSPSITRQSFVSTGGGGSVSSPDIAREGLFGGLVRTGTQKLQRTVPGFLTERIALTRDFFSGKTREELIRQETRTQLVSGFESLTPQQRSAASFIAGTGITRQGDFFEFEPSEAQIQLARTEAEQTVGQRGRGTGIAVGATKGVVGVGEFIVGLPFEFGAGQIRPGEEAFRPGQEIVSKIPFVGERVERLKARPTGFTGTAAEITTGFLIPVAGATFQTIKRGRQLAKLGFTRGEVAGELISEVSPIKVSKRIFQDDISKLRFESDVGQISVRGGGPIIQIEETRGIGAPDVRGLTVGITPKGQPTFGVARVRQPVTELRFDLLGGAKTRTFTRIQEIPIGSIPKGQEFPSFGVLEPGAQVGLEFPRTQIQDVFAKRGFTTETGRGFAGERFTDITLRTDQPITTARTFVGERRVGERTFAELGGVVRIEAERGVFGAGEDVLVGVKPTAQPRRFLERIRFLQPQEGRAFGFGETPFFARTRGRIRRAEISLIEPEAGVGIGFRGRGRGGRGAGARTIQQELTSQFADVSPSLTEAAFKAVGQVPRQAPQTGFPTLVGGAGARGQFTGLGLFERTELVGPSIGPRTGGRALEGLFEPRFQQPIPVTTLAQPTTALETEISKGRLGFAPRLGVGLATGLGISPRLIEAQVEVSATRGAGGFGFRAPTSPTTTVAAVVPRGGVRQPRPRFGLPFFFPSLGFPGERKVRRKGKRKFKRVPSLIALELDITALEPVPGERTGLVARPIVKKRKRRK